MARQRVGGGSPTNASERETHKIEETLEHPDLPEAFPAVSLDAIKAYIAEYTALLPLSKSISYSDAEKRASQFLTAQARLSDWRHELTELKIKYLSVQTAVYAEQMSKGQAKTVTENKLTAEASKEYTKAREDLERIENDLAYLKAYYDIFQNGHLFYRQMAKGESFGG